jgi:hypothetical protein
VHLRQAASEDLDDSLITVEHDVASKVDTHPPFGATSGDRPDVIVHRIAHRKAETGRRMTDTHRVVEHQRGLETGEARGDHLGTTREAGKEMGFYESGADAYVGFHPLPIEMDRHVTAHPPKVDQTGRVTGVVVDHSHPA